MCPIKGVTLKVKVGTQFSKAKVYGLKGEIQDAQVEIKDGVLTAKLDLPLYVIVELH